MCSDKPVTELINQQEGLRQHAKKVGSLRAAYYSGALVVS